MGRLVLALTLAVVLAATAVACGGTDDATGAEGMPGFSESLSAAEIEAVTEYVAGGLQ
jgi:mono/diheme cytochrome c family protein